MATLHAEETLARLTGACELSVSAWRAAQESLHLTPPGVT